MIETGLTENKKLRLAGQLMKQLQKLGCDKTIRQITISELLEVIYKLNQTD